VIGAVLAGGAARRMRGRSKAAALLRGRPLLSYPAAALASVCDRVAVLCKPATPLPDLPGTERWEEPEEPVHPLTAITHALERARAPVMVCAGDMPFVTPDACRSLLMAAGGGDAAAAVAIAGGVLQPAFGVYAPVALDALRASESSAGLTATVEALDPVRVAFPPRLVASVETPEELAQAESALG
jgi:molybdenum cofactor guanylyltransferase